MRTVSSGEAGGDVEAGGDLHVMRRMLGLARPMAGTIALAVLFGIVGHLCATFIPVLAVAAGLSAAGVIAHPSGLTLTSVIAVLVAMSIVRGVLHYIEQTCNHYIAFKLLASIRDRVFASLRRLAPAKLAGADKGSLISTITADVELLEVFYAHTISPICIAVGTSIVMIVFMGSLNPLFGLVGLVAYLVVGALVPVLLSRLTGDTGRRCRELAGDLSGFVLDSLRGLREARQFGAGGRRLEELDSRSRELVRVQGLLNDRSSDGIAITSGLILLFGLGQLVLGALLFQAGSVGAGAVVLATVSILSSFGPTTALAALGVTLQGTIASGARVLAVLDEEPVVPEQDGGCDVEFSGAAAEHVSFSYGGEQILSDVSAEVPANGIVGITGRSGSGKSTLCRLLMRFWDVDEGRVALSGKDVRDINTSSLREAEALVEQDTHLFHDSILDNLLLARPDATREQVEEACKAASVHDFIMSLPQGYDTMVGELGDTLSGGERQRLGLARAFLHGAPFLLLDEPTSNLDSLNEGAILRSLGEQRASRTVLLISHRASTMGIADEVIEMRSGRVS
ncbi:amino acid ABC transporter ATP-binding/permease protein [Olsenella uli]|uniref:amino acid ABC transporter ATP-binding/permease protein n=1 Tax=Olsenella uli TaxID=133926 RepID=UPI0004464706|nr:ABC transporter ATP-binding protein [Olsenella uli]EUB32000.1 ABC transporter, ATP-binding protein [Olsenella uli MSTE5]